MNEAPRPSPAPEDPRIRFAAERTMLAWIRTGLSLMAFGFVVARFGLFLRELEQGVIATGQPLRHSPWSPRLGVLFVMLGVTTTVVATLRQRTILQRLDRQEAFEPSALSLEIIVAGVLAVLGILLALYLILLSPDISGSQ